MMQICFDKLSKFIFQCVDFGLVHVEGGGRGEIIFSKYGMKDKWPPIKLLECVFSNKKNPMIGIFLISKYALLYENYLSVCSDKMFTRRKYISICQSI